MRIKCWLVVLKGFCPHLLFNCADKSRVQQLPSNEVDDKFGIMRTKGNTSQRQGQNLLQGPLTTFQEKKYSAVSGNTHGGGGCT